MLAIWSIFNSFLIITVMYLYNFHRYTSLLLRLVVADPYNACRRLGSHQIEIEIERKICCEKKKNSVNINHFSFDSEVI